MTEQDAVETVPSDTLSPAANLYSANLYWTFGFTFMILGGFGVLITLAVWSWEHYLAPWGFWLSFGALILGIWLYAWSLPETSANQAKVWRQRAIISTVIYLIISIAYLAIPSRS